MFDIQYHDNPALVLKPHPSRSDFDTIGNHYPPCPTNGFNSVYTLGAGRERSRSDPKFSGPVRIQSGLEWFGSCLQYDVIRTS